MSNKIDQDEYEELEGKCKKLKRINNWLTFFVIVGVFGAIVVIELYLHKDAFEKTNLAKKLKSYRNEISSKYNVDTEYVESVHNAAYKLDLSSVDKTNQGVHPKVINFEKKWHGYKYWMSFSPYPDGNDKYENPYLVASNDLIHWEAPKGLKNPIEDTPKEYEHEKVYNSDPHIVYNKDKDVMELYFRYVNVNKDQMILYKKTSKNGVDWTDKKEVLSVKVSKKDYISPAIIYDDGIYKMWYVDKNRVVKYTESKDGKNWKKERTIILYYPQAHLTTWHLDVIKTEKGYELLSVAYKNWKDRNAMNLYYFKSKDNQDYEQGIIILRPSLISWDNRGIYRSSFIYENGTYYVFYSALSTQFERGIGFSYGEHIENLVGSNIKEKEE